MGPVDALRPDTVSGGRTEINERDRIQSIERGVAVLRAFSGRETTLTVAEISKRVGLARPVVRRILITYEHLGYARSINGVWGLTPRILEIGSGYFASTSLPELSYPYMSSIVEQTGTTASVGSLDGFEVIHVARVEDERPLPDSVRVGGRLPSYATATGRVLLGGLDDQELEERVSGAGAFEVFTPHTMTDPDALLARVRDVRERGYDVSIEELHPGQIAAAVPIAVDDEVVGALTASSTTVRQSERSLVESVIPVLIENATAVASVYRNANPHLFRRR